MKKSSILSAACLAFSLACGGGASVPLETTPRAPAAIGVVDVTQGPNNNTIGKLHVKHLAPPAELRGDLTVYVAWVRPVGASQWQNVGQLMVGESREGDLELRVPHDQFEFSVSAESDGGVRDPSDFIVLRGQIDSRSAS